MGTSEIGEEKHIIPKVQINSLHTVICSSHIVNRHIKHNYFTSEFLELPCQKNIGTLILYIEII